MGEYIELNPELRDNLDVTVCKGGLMELTCPTLFAPLFSVMLGAPFVLFVGTLDTTAAAGVESFVVLLLLELGV